MNPLFSAALKALLLLVATLFAASIHASESERGEVEVLLERVEGLATHFGRLYEEREGVRPAANDEARLRGVHQRLLAAVESLHDRAAAADHRTARHILERFNDSALSFARNYLGPGEAVIERRGDRETLRHYRRTVSRMKGNLFSWNPDLDELMRDLLEVTRTVEGRMAYSPLATL